MNRKPEGRLLKSPTDVEDQLPLDEKGKRGQYCSKL